MAKVNWNLDTAHSEVGFSVKHMMISKAKGTFDNFDAKIVADAEDLTDAEIELNIDVESINTRNKDRDDHLRSADFFDAENYPKITFVATDIKKSGNNYEVTGDLTLKGTTKPVTLDVVFEGQSKDPMSGSIVAGFSGSTSINRKEFGLTWNASLETGGVLVGEEVKINFELELQKAE
ncbi:polyisoprenoid-binding protein [Oceanobacillus oncorhynchi subsp. incaldanensis]|uniref:Protein YceI n=2 Tax=Oceanobacillus TaxID=182709 RepID=A0A0A1MLN8_9BACI|nr:YceI family protein [Oceanobacillus oncorhynchi]MDM8100550.1 YceI family protein [Oceanobacillus oncorhynchi]UUI38316.1 YceI family protein [Oceanobacillus oncorhynchi]GIO16957.1 polyisoprenoid-binding protein [Oceanobacillus oncorhynchi subsp. incaldanensis]CEI83988.1 Protein YceI [Oceanobacillus oncorhynchi]